jgi:acid phosphatase
MRDVLSRLLRALAAAAGLALLLALPAKTASSPPPAPSLQSIQHVVVIYQENWSFDSLYGKLPGADGLNDVPALVKQVDKVSGAALTALPQPLSEGGKPDPNFPAGLPVAPYDAMKYIRAAALTGDLVHRFYQEQSQIDGGKMDGFVTWSDNPGLALSYFDATGMPEGRFAQRYTVADNFFHSAFGGSFLNHVWLVCACTPTFPNAPAALVASVDGTGKALALDGDGKIVKDGAVTPDGYAVNTIFPVNSPHPARVATERLLPSQTMPTIGDRLSAAGITWKWYSGGWDDALAGRPDPLFQFHHQPFAYFASFADGTPARAAHLQDEKNFFGDLQNRTLPSVSFVKPLGPDNEHPGYASLMAGQEHVASLIDAIGASPYWRDTAIVITYDENGGRWDHVAPPGPFDRWGPGTRVPTIVISPWAKRHFVDHTRYETVSILALIEKRWDLKPLGARDAAANPLSEAFDFAQPPDLAFDPIR